MNLYQIADQLANTPITDEDGVVTDEGLALVLQMHGKAAAVAGWALRQRDEAEVVRTQAIQLKAAYERMNERANLLDANADHALQYLAEQAAKVNELTIEDPNKHFVIKISPNRYKSVKIVDASQIPADLKRTPAFTPPEPQPDKELIKAKLLDGASIPGVALVQKHGIQIK